MNEQESIESLFIDKCFFFPLTCFSLVTFPRNSAQIFRSDRSTYIQNIFFHSFYTVEVMTHFLAKESFLNKYLATLFRYNSWDLIWILKPSFLQSAFNHNFYGGYQISTFYLMNYGNHFTKKQSKKNACKTKRTNRLIWTLSRMSVLTDFFINTIFFVYIRATWWDFSYFILEI